MFDRLKNLKVKIPQYTHLDKVYKDPTRIKNLNIRYSLTHNKYVSDYYVTYTPTSKMDDKLLKYKKFLENY